MIRRAPDHSSRLALGEHAAEEATQRFAVEHPEAFMRRREFLLRTAALAGGVSLAGVLPTDRLVAEAARRGAYPLPAPRNMPLDTVVVLMMENRSFDHYFGWVEGADGRNAGLSYEDLDGVAHPTHHLPPDWQGCGFRDPNHGWSGGRHQYGAGRMDGFYRGNREGTGSDEFALGYYLEEDLGILATLAGSYTLYDRWFCSLMASTFPNRHYQMSGQSGGTTSNEVPGDAEGFQWETIFDRALARGLSVGYYVSDLPAPALYGRRGLEWVRPVAEFYADAALGRLPNVCFVDPPFGDIGTLGLGASDHPHSDIRAGQAFVADVASAFVESPQYRRGALFVNYDEWGGFFDHVRPPRLRDDRNSPKLADDFGFCGFRIPGICVSPFARAGGVSHMQVTHESILKLISYRWQLGALTTRHRFASNIGKSLRFFHPDYEVPKLPDPAMIMGVPCAVQGGREAQRRLRPKGHDMQKLQTSGLLDRLGYEVGEPAFRDIFRLPDSVQRALAEAESIPAGTP